MADPPAGPRRGHPGPAGSGFRLLWAAAGVSAAGSGLRATVLPLLAAATSTDPRSVAGVVAAGLLPWPLLGLLTGVLADRLDRRRLIVTVHLARAAVMALATAAVAAHTTPIPLLAAVAFTVAAGTTVDVNTSTALLPQLVTAAGLPAANSRLVTTTMLAGDLLAPAAAGVLYATAAVVPAALDALSFAVAALLLHALPAPPRPTPRRRPRPGPTVRGELTAGARLVLHHPLLRPLTALVTVLAGASGAVSALLVLDAEHTLHLPAAGYGPLVSAYAAGGLLGAASATRLQRRYPAGALTLTAPALTVTALSGLAVATSPALAAASLTLLGVAVGLWHVTTTSLLQTAVPTDALGRVSATFHTAAATAAALGALTAGALAAHTGIPAVLQLCAASVALTAFPAGKALRTAAKPTRPRPTPSPSSPPHTQPSDQSSD